MTRILNAQTRDEWSVERMADALTAVYDATDDSVIVEGRAWYPRTLALAAEMARETGRTVECAAGVIAAMSPRLQWHLNVQYAWDILRGGSGSGLTRSLANAHRIVQGAHPLDVLNGPKTRAFYGAIMGTGHTATVDAWAVQGATERAYGAVAPARYDDVAAAYATAAERCGENVHAMQAIVWVAVNAAAQRAMDTKG
jgi:hypothetical protein